MLSAQFSDFFVDVHGQLPVGEGHVLHWEQYGSSRGMPIVALHGGPGGACTVRQRRQFDPALWRTTLFDQRGCSNSSARDDLHANTTAHLVADIDALRCHLGIDRWHVAGGSWGATLALAYAAAHPDRVSGLILRNPFLVSRHEVACIFDRWAAPFDWPAHMPLGDRLAAVRTALGGPAAHAAVRAWRTREWQRGRLLMGDALASEADAVDDIAPEELRRYLVQAHYLASSCFLDVDEVIDSVAMSQLPVIIVQGESAQLCSNDNTRRLADALPQSRLKWVPEGGHDPYHPAMLQAWHEALAMVFDDRLACPALHATKDSS